MQRSDLRSLFMKETNLIAAHDINEYVVWLEEKLLQEYSICRCVVPKLPVGFTTMEKPVKCQVCNEYIKSEWRNQ